MSKYIHTPKDIDMTVESTYRELLREQQDIRSFEQQELNEFRILRGAAALALAAKSKQYGDKASQDATKGKGSIGKVSREETVEDKINRLAEGLEQSLNAQINIRNQIGSLVGICLTAALIAERSDKELRKLSKPRRR